MYRVSQIVIDKKSYLYDYCMQHAGFSCALYNAALFRIRQVFTGYDKTDRSQNEALVFGEVDCLEKQFPSIHVKRVISYSHLEKLMRVTSNPDFFAGLPMQTAQHVLKTAIGDFKNWLAALKDYKNHPDKYLGRPQMPHYKKTGLYTFTITNQDAVLYPCPDENGLSCGMELKLPLVKERCPLPHLTGDALLKEVKIKPYYGRFILSLTMEVADTVADTVADRDMPYIASIDFGTDNLAAIVCNDSSSRIYKGGAVLSENQWFAKQKAYYTGMLTKGHAYEHASSRRLTDLSFHHANFIKDQMHKVSADIVRWCVLHRAGTLILGVNRYWKQNSGIGTVNNQSFTATPTSLLRALIAYKANMAGISVMEQEESYTSKADITSMDYIPVYGVDDERASFSGTRIRRGLYRCASGLIVNADCNGAANIMRKAVPYAWKGCHDFGFLGTPEVFGFHELNPLSIPVKRIAA